MAISRYGKFGATPEEIEAAAKSAQMHDRIMSFPEGADTSWTFGIHANIRCRI